MAFKDREYKKQYDRRRYAENVEFVRRYKVEKGCADCGYNLHHAGLQFDHLPGFDKVRNVTACLSRESGALMEEIKKCEVVCSTCHSIRTFERGQQSYQIKNIAMSEELESLSVEGSTLEGASVEEEVTNEITPAQKVLNSEGMEEDAVCDSCQ